LASRFNVSVPFILQQAAWLYEQELQQVRAQMQRVNRSSRTIEQGRTSVSSERQPSPSGPLDKSGNLSFTITRNDPRVNGVPPGVKSSPPLSNSDSSSSLGSVSYNGDLVSSRKLLSMSRNFSRLRDYEMDINNEDLENQDDEAFAPVSTITGARKTLSNESSSSVTDPSDASVSKSALEDAFEEFLDDSLADRSKVAPVPR
jgi:hypothetical protein